MKIVIGSATAAVCLLLGQSAAAPEPAAFPHLQAVQADVSVIPDAAASTRPAPKPTQASQEAPPPAVADATPPPPPAARRPIPPYVEIGAMTSRPGEAKEAFLVRLAQTMDLFTRTTGHEACGLIMESETGGVFRVRLTSNRAHISCTMMSFREPGFRPIGEDIHTHPRIVGGVKSNGPDVRSRSDLRCGNRIVIYDEIFSDVDFNNGPGYLVARGKLLFQHGAQWPMRQVAELDMIEEGAPLQIGGLDASGNEELAAAAWSNQEVEGLPSTQCPDPPVEQETPPAPQAEDPTLPGPR